MHAAVAYAGEAERWVRAFKYPARELAALDPAPGAVVRAWVREAACSVPGPGPDLVVPVPLHPRRLRARRFNPASVLAREAAASRHVRFTATALERVRDTPSQTGLGRRARRRNVAGAFRCRKPVPASVWLVDDVVTTGATLAECARILRRAGARRIVGLCAARTP